MTQDEQIAELMKLVGRLRDKAVDQHGSIYLDEAEEAIEAHARKMVAPAPEVRSELISALRKAADEIGSSGFNGWGNLCSDAANFIAAAPQPAPAVQADQQTTELSELPNFDDPQVQIAYEILARADLEPPLGEHWEGFAARHIIAALRQAMAAREQS